MDHRAADEYHSRKHGGRKRSVNLRKGLTAFSPCRGSRPARMTVEVGALVLRRASWSTPAPRCRLRQREMPLHDHRLIPGQARVVRCRATREALAQTLTATGEIVQRQNRDGVRRRRESPLPAEAGGAPFRRITRIPEHEHLFTLRERGTPARSTITHPIPGSAGKSQTR